MGERDEGGIPAEVVEVSALAELTRAEVDQQIATAKHYKRDVATFLKRARTMIGEDRDLAAACGYETKRGGKVIMGPSVRLAEIAVIAWGNVRVQVVEEPFTPNKDRNVRCHATFHDLESNVAIRVPKVRRTTTSEGKPYGDDMMVTTQNANISVAYRDCILRGIPRNFIHELYNHAMGVAAGNIDDMPAEREKFLKAFESVGVPRERLFRALQIDGIESVTKVHLGAMHGVYQQLKRGEIKPEEAFPKEDSEVAGDAAARTTATADRIKKGAAKGKSEKAPEPPAGDADKQPNQANDAKKQDPPKKADEAKKPAEQKPAAAGEIPAGAI